MFLDIYVPHFTIKSYKFHVLFEGWSEDSSGVLDHEMLSISMSIGSETGDGSLQLFSTRRDMGYSSSNTPVLSVNSTR